MFSAVYKFCYSSTPTEPSCHPSPIHDHSDEMQPIFDIPSPASLDSFLSMDVSMDIPSFNVTECGSSDSCYDFSNLSQDVWAINPPSPISTDLSGCSPSLFSINLSTCSPSHFSADPSTCYERYFSDSYPSPPMTLSPASPSFSLDLSHFVSCLHMQPGFGAYMSSRSLDSFTSCICKSNLHGRDLLWNRNL